MKRWVSVIAILFLSFANVFAGGRGSRHRKPDHRPNHESKHKLQGGHGSSHKGAKLKPGEHYDRKR